MSKYLRKLYSVRACKIYADRFTQLKLGNKNNLVYIQFLKGVCNIKNLRKSEHIL
jgi:outer membrane protein assembly factor BamD (BamD/ComL family)